ncbi:site-specific integrase [Alicyclobacillus fastidiosus]|uniref:Site-specific integrase n=1 Tax=Alicyclobacillus fastidiosus TaxID=392011 RepID=A0ABV5AEK6_9BACL|nr:site-specific integrase [Alicyclobacillus fastidiosus]WEH09746.1 site-specific integrase [Alicyclobacillus fastidiosus]
MRGSVKKDGRSWYIVFDMGTDPITGKRRQKKKRGFGTKKDAESALAKMMAEAESGMYAHSEKTTVDKFIAQWLEDKKPSVRKSTHRSYEWLMRRHVIPYIGSVRLSKLSPMHLQRLYSTLQTNEKPISNRSILHVHLVLQEALDRAVKWGMVPRNVAKAVDPPRPQKVHFQVWTQQETLQFIEIARDDRYYIAFLLAITTGMRKGEILGLRWQDIDLHQNIVSVRQTLSYTGKGSEFQPPKTDHANAPFRFQFR